MLSKTVYEDIPSPKLGLTFGRVMFDKYSLIIIKENGFINATKLCDLDGEDFEMWKIDDKSKELLELFSSMGAFTSSPIIALDESWGPELCGQYIHQRLLPYVCYWLSVDFAILMGRVMDRYTDGKIAEQLSL